MRSPHRSVPGLLAAIAVLALACESPPPPPPAVPLYEPSSPLPIRVSFKLGTSAGSQVFGSHVLLLWREMGLFERLVHPPNALRPVEVGLQLRIDAPVRGASRNLSHDVVAAVYRGDEEVMRYEYHVAAEGEPGWRQNLDQMNVEVQRQESRRIALGLAKRIDTGRDEFLARVRSASE